MLASAMTSDIVSIAVIMAMWCWMLLLGSPVYAFTASLLHERIMTTSQRVSTVAASRQTHTHTLHKSRPCHRNRNHNHQYQYQSPQQYNHVGSQLFSSNTPTDDGNNDEAQKQQQQHEQAMLKALKAMTSFSNKYIENTQTYYCSDLSIPAVVIKGLAEHKVKLGAPLCPCRFYEDKEKEAKDGYWNCPCVPMRERHECHCMLFLTEENDFAGSETVVTVEEVQKLSGGFSS